MYVNLYLNTGNHQLKLQVLDITKDCPYPNNSESHWNLDLTKGQLTDKICSL